MTTRPENAEQRPDSAAEGTSCACGAWWRLPLLLALVLVAVAVINGPGIREGTTPADEAASNGNGGAGRSGGSPDAAPSGQTVSLVVEFGDGRRREWNAVPWRDGLTVADLMVLARRAAPADDGFDFAQQGAGPSAFLTHLGGVANEGAAGRNWTYYVNGNRADRSFAVYSLQPGDAVLWKFEAGE